MFINIYKFVGEKEQDAFLEKRLNSFSSMEKHSFDDFFKDFESIWNRSDIQLFDNLSTYLTDQGWINQLGNVIHIPKRITQGDYSMHADTIIKLLEKSIQTNTPITNETLSQAFQLSWKTFSTLDEKISKMMDKTIQKTKGLFNGGPKPMGIYNNIVHNQLSSKDYAMAHDFALLEFHTLKTTMIHFGKESKKVDTKKKETKKKEKEAEEKTMAIIRNQAMQRAKELREQQKRSKKPKGG